MLEGAIVFNLLVAGLLTCILGLIALVLLQRAILRYMTATVGRRLDKAREDKQTRCAAAVPLVLAIESLASRTKTASSATRVLRRVALAHAFAGLAFAVAATLLLLTMSGMQLLPLRTIVVVWAIGWPTLLVLSLLIGPDRPVQMLLLLSYLGGLLVLCSVAQLAGTEDLSLGPIALPGFFQPAVVWMIYAVPSAFLLLFLNRTIRTIGPLVLAFVFVVLIGSHVALTMLTFDPILLAVLNVAVAIGLGGHGAFFGMACLGMLAACWPAWMAVALLRNRYASKRLSEFMLTVGAIWLLQTLVLASSLLREQGAFGVAVAAFPLLVWRLTLSFGLRATLREARTRPPHQLLLLRVFGFGRRSRRLLDLLGSRWRLLGSIDLIAAPDLASRTVEPVTFIEFIRGRLAHLFIRTQEDLRTRLTAMDHAPDPDARFRINQLFCSEDVWQEAVTRLMEGATLVVMDLRGFTPDRRGCVFELQMLLDRVSVSRLCFLVDHTTNLAGLKTVLTEHWQRLDAASPNLTPGNATLRMLDVSGSESHATRRLLAMTEKVG